MSRFPTATATGTAAAVIALLGATSCVAPERQAYRISQVVPEPAARVLLRRLALDVPADVPTSADVQAEAPLTAAPAFLGPQAADDAARARDCLTAVIYYEARSQGREGERAVAQVVLNRVRDRAFPKSVCGVVYQGSTRATGCQFSFTCDGSMNARRNERSWAEAQAVADAALAGEVYAPVGSATHYHADYVTPWWSSSLARVVKVGAHVFYRWRGALENALAFRQHYAGVEPEVGGDVAAADTGGVTVHYGNRPEEVSSGVTIHRGAFASDTGAARASVVSGVRIHVGSAHEIDGGGDEAVVSDEI